MEIRSVAERPRALQLMDDDLDGVLDPAQCPEAVENIQALARLAASKAFRLLKVRDAERWPNWEDAVQEAAWVIRTDPTWPPRKAYQSAKRQDHVMVRGDVTRPAIIRVPWRSKRVGLR